MLLKLAALAADAGDSARRAADLGLAMLRNRLRLLSLELREEQLRLVQAFAWILLGLGLVFIGVVLGVLAVIYAVDEARRLEALAWCAAVLLAAGALALALALMRFRRRPAPFSQTIAELGKDQAWLSGKSSGS